ncbi:MAG: hypothetical protein HOV79_06040 [Hamadaea sp.]|nr:hypothetical protein [Hamadaea sp.]
MIREGPLCLSQRWPWLDHYRPREAREFEDCRTVADVPPNLDRAAVAGVLRALVDRHEALRSSVRIGPGDEPIQRVHPADVVVPAVLDDPEEHPETLVHGEATPRPEALSGQADVGVMTNFFRDARHVLDLSRPPAHLAIVERRGRPVKVLVSVDHIVADAWAGEVIIAELRELLDAAAQGRAPDLPEPSVQPIDLALRERDDDAADAPARAYAEEQLRRLPATLFPDSAPGTTRTSVQVDLQSPAVALALALLSRRLRAPAPVISRLAFSACLSMATGFADIGVEIQSANRFGRDQAGLVASRVQPMFATAAIDLAEPLAALVAREARSAVAALRRSEGDHLARLALRVRAEHDRGLRFYAIPEFNYFRAPGTSTGQPEPDEVRAAAKASVFDVHPVVDWYDRFRFQSGIFDASGTYLTVLASERIMDADRAQAFLRAYEQILVSACEAEEPLARVAAEAGLLPPRRPAHWIRTEHGWADPQVVRDLLATCPEVASCAVFADGDRLLAHVVRAADNVRESDVHTSLLGRLPDSPAAVAPARYALYDRAPADPDRPSAWAALGVQREGDGRAVTARAPRTPGERLLAATLERHGLAAPALDACYAAAGGELWRVPAILTELADLGHDGLDVRDFLSLDRLADLAARLS